MQTFQFSHAAFLKQKTKRNEVICKYFMFYWLLLLYLVTDGNQFEILFEVVKDLQKTL